MAERDAEINGSGSDGPGAVAKAAGVLVLVALLAGAVLAAIGIYPHKVPEPKNPSFVDDVFVSPIVVLFVRIAIVFAAGYVVISVIGLIHARRWIAELGPFKASEPIRRLGRGAEGIEVDLREALKTIEELEERLRQDDLSLAEANGHIAALLDHMSRLGEAKERT